jgi:hypothetical protein
MRKIFASKITMMIAGVLAAVIIAFSQSFYHQTKASVSKSKTEQNSDDHTQTFLSTPSDAVSPSSAIQLNDQVPSLKESVDFEKKIQSPLIIQGDVFVKYLKVLFRVIISPNAP